MKVISIIKYTHEKIHRSLCSHKNQSIVHTYMESKKERDKNYNAKLKNITQELLGERDDDPIPKFILQPINFNAQNHIFIHTIILRRTITLSKSCN